MPSSLPIYTYVYMYKYVLVGKWESEPMGGYYLCLESILPRVNNTSPWVNVHFVLQPDMVQCHWKKMLPAHKVCDYLELRGHGFWCFSVIKFCYIGEKSRQLICPTLRKSHNHNNDDQKTKQNKKKKKNRKHLISEGRHEDMQFWFGGELTFSSLLLLKLTGTHINLHFVTALHFFKLLHHS